MLVKTAQNSFATLVQQLLKLVLHFGEKTVRKNNLYFLQLNTKI